MQLNSLLLTEFDTEIQKTRVTLARLPEDKPDFKPHDRSASLIKLANHTAELPAFLSIILTTDEYDVMQGALRPAPPSTTAARLVRFDSLAARARHELAATTDHTMHEAWKLCSGGHTRFNSSRYQAVRAMFFNHMIHHRAQLGVYLRLNDIPVPPIYGPSADES